MTFHEQLLKLGACDEAVNWVGDKTLECAYNSCDRLDWLIWLAGRVGFDRRVIVHTACDLAEPALVHVPADEDRPRLLIAAARAWCDGTVTISEVRLARNAARHAYAACGVGHAYAVCAACAAARAARAAESAGYVTVCAATYDDDYAAHAARAAADAATYAGGAAFIADAATYDDIRRAQAETVRRNIPLAVLRERLEGVL